VCEPAEAVAELQRALSESPKAEAWVTVRLLDARDDKPVATARFLAAVRKF
jgi:hypothetical protein